MKRHRTWVEVSEKSLRHNVEQLRALVDPRARFCAVVKANAYGHGLKEVAGIAYRADVDAFAVDHIDDALFLRDLFPSALILVLGFTLFDRFKDAVIGDIHLTVYDRDGVEEAHRKSDELARSISIHLKLETGTVRQGVALEDLPDLAMRIVRSKHVKLEGISTHFANIEDSENPDFAASQFALFEQGVAILATYGLTPAWRHCACSAAIVLYPQTHQTLVRAGLGLYGLWSSELVQRTARRLNLNVDLEPVLTWKTCVAQIKSISMGTPIGYGLTEVMKRSGRVAILPIGYWDGYRRSLSGIGEVLIRGERCKVMGRVGMNMMCVNVSTVVSIQKEDEVILLGTDGRHRLTADDLAQKTGTISYEIVTQINPLLPRLIV